MVHVSITRIHPQEVLSVREFWTSTEKAANGLAEGLNRTAHEGAFWRFLSSKPVTDEPTQVLHVGS